MIIISKIHFLTFLVLVLFLITKNYNEAKCVERDRQALLKFKAGLIDDAGQLSSWEHKDDCCLWNGIVCDNRTSQVVQLDLSGIPSLQGKMISPSLLELEELSHLDLSFIDFNYSQKIPNFIGSLTKLRYLNLRECNFYGEVPHSLGNLSMLQFLNLTLHSSPSDVRSLETNHLGWISSLQSLEILDLSLINISDNGEWLHAINKLPMVKEIYLKDCYLNDALPISQMDMVNASNSLLVLDLSSNFLSHSSNFLCLVNHSNSLRYIDLSGNYFNGTIPEILWSSTNLNYLNLRYNEFEGTISNSLGNLTSLFHLDLFGNRLQGEFTSDLSGLTYLDLSYNGKIEGDFTHLMMHLWNSTLLEYIGLSGNALFGSLPNMSRFQLLKELKLYHNHLNGSIGEDSLRLPALQVLNLERNILTGMIPNLSSCLSLKVLYLEDNMFNGTLTESIGSLFQLEKLLLGSNHLEGLISEAHLFNLSNLKFLHLSFNSNITISFNPSWTPPFQLVAIDLANCRLGPKFPQWLQTQSNVSFLDISNSKIRDTIPDWFWRNFTEVSWVNMSHNNIHGTLPHWSFKDTVFLDLSFNQLCGTLPQMSTFPGGKRMILSANKFSGTCVFCDFSGIDLLDVSNNLLSGHISQGCFKNLSGLLYLNLENNNLSGNIQVSVTSCRLSSLYLRNNRFTGYIPKSLRACPNLNILDLGENNFIGNIPDWLGESLPKVSVLSLKSNQLHGSLPSSICHLSRIQVLDISRNMISGTIPKCIYNFTLLSSKINFNPKIMGVASRQNTTIELDSFSLMWKGKNSAYIQTLRLLKAIDFSCNKLSGEIPNEITRLVEVVSLNLSSNNLIGSIPHDINRLELLDVLDLSRNNLSGGIPLTLSLLSHLGTLNLSFNNLSGKIPWDTHMVTFDAASYIGNPGLCGPPLVSNPCPTDVEIPRKPILNEWIHEDIFKTREFYISMACGFIIAFWGVSGTLILNKRWNIALVKVFSSIDDWIYSKIGVNLQKYFQN